MNSDNSRGTFEDVVRKYKPPIAEIAHKLRDLILMVYPEVSEVPRPAEQHIGYGVGLKKATEIFGYVCPLADYVRLGFYYGGSLPDPKGLLVGEGKRLRHIKIYSLAEVKQSAVKQLVVEAVKERKKAHGLK